MMSFADESKIPGAAATVANQIQRLFNQKAPWLTGRGAASNLVISTRIRLARNLSKFAFPNRAKAEALQQVILQVQTVLNSLNSLRNSFFFQISELSELDRTFLMERHLISPGLLNPKVPAAVLISPDEDISIMLNEEDHLRIQVLQAGLELEQAWRIIRRLDDALSRNLEFAFSDTCGYLTACPTNTGTGMRVSVAINLNFISLKENLKNFIKTKFPREITIRGFYGEGSDVMGNIFQISNQFTLGRTEEGILEQIQAFALKLQELEEQAGLHLLQNNRILIEDKVFRALAILRHARLINSIEALNLIAFLRLGRQVGLLSGFNFSDLNQLMLEVQSAHLQKHYAKVLTAAERDQLRPEFIQKKIKL
ncbi:protein arginine kinase [candidate division KSB1 bacterium]|nr:protein arginine kinase [candidate division KSB1 bacterium]